MTERQREFVPGIFFLYGLTTEKEREPTVERFDRGILGLRVSAVERRVRDGE